MKTKNKILYFIIFQALFYISTQGQKTLIKYDTVFLYEKVTIYDTIIVNQYPHLYPLLSKKAMSVASFEEKKIYALTNKLCPIIATNNKSCIILSDNQKKERGMKKASLFLLMFNAINIITSGQNDYGVTIGTGAWWSTCDNPKVNGIKITEPDYSPDLLLGVYYTRYVNSRIYIQTKINYQLLWKNYSYKASGFSTYDYEVCWGSKEKYGDITITDQNNDPVPAYYIIGEEESNIIYNTIEMPFIAGYQLGKFNPLIGISCWLKQFKSNNSNSFINGFGINIGITYNITSLLNIGILYSKSLTKDYEYTGYIIDKSKHIISNNKYKWKYGYFNITLSFSLKAPPSEN